MFEEDGYFIVNSQEEADKIEQFLIKNNYSIYSKGNKYTSNTKCIKVYPPKNNIKNYSFLSFIVGKELKLSDYNISIESKIREIFDNPNNVIACISSEEKHKLFTLLNKLEYKTRSNRTYNIDCIGHYDIKNGTIVSEGSNISIKDSLTDRMNIIYFSDLKNLIKE